MNNKFTSVEVPNFSIASLRILGSPLNELLIHIMFGQRCTPRGVHHHFGLIHLDFKKKVLVQLRHYIVKVHKRAHVRVSLIAFILLFIGSIQSRSVRMAVLDDSMNTLSVLLLRV